MKYRSQLNVKREKGNNSLTSVINVNDSFISTEVTNETPVILQVESHNINTDTVPDILMSAICKAKFHCTNSSDFVVEITPEMKIGLELKGQYNCMTC